MKPLQFEVTCHAIQDILVQVYHVGFLASIEVVFEDFHVMNSEETTIQLGKLNVTNVAIKINDCEISMNKDIKYEIQGLASNMKVVTLKKKQKVELGKMMIMIFRINILTIKHCCV
jgi:hypothetical protein